MKYGTIITDGAPFRVQEHGGDRRYDCIGYYCDSSGVAREIVIPDYLELGEPLPAKAEDMLPRRYYGPEVDAV